MIDSVELTSKLIALAVKHPSDRLNLCGKALLVACMSGAVKVASHLLAPQTDPNVVAVDPNMEVDQWTLLSVASEFGQKDMVRLLLSSGANVMERCTKSKMTSIHYAALLGHLDITHLLLDAGADVNCKERSDGRTPFMLAAFEGHLKVAQLLFESGAESESRDTDNATPLHWAARNGHPDEVKFIVDKGADVNCKDSSECTPLMNAAWYGHLSAVQVLIEQGADLNARCAERTRQGWTCLLFAAECGDADGAKVDPRGNENETPLMVATYQAGAKQGHFAAVQLLVEAGADVEATDKSGMTPFLYAAAGRQLEMVRFVLDNGANIENKDNQNNTALLRAAFLAQSIEEEEYFSELFLVIQLLVERGADIEATNHDGSTPLLPAVGGCFVELVRFLLDNGANVKAKDNSNNTSLHVAVQSVLKSAGDDFNAQLEIVQLLIDKGVDVGARDEDGMTALEMALEYGHAAVADILAKAEENVK
ncbi:hypothetical protein HDU96_004461 [Phlyctochytrium bullatum]|nr:hypothetical protein HDU96_004461 [Phlyctochytrium bullatum]